MEWKPERAGKPTVINFNIAQWQAWAPGLTSADDWLKWSHAPCRLDCGDAAPDVSFLPAMQRRRLGRLARMAFHVGWPLADARPPMPLVFMSRHGETPLTFNILGDLAARQPLSPTQFSLSVHNAVIGLWSILRAETSEMTALAAAGDGLEHGLIEAAALLDDGAEAVLLIISEEQPPAAYAQWITDIPFPYAVGLVITAGDDWSLSLTPASTDAPACQWPHALNLLRALVTDQTDCHHVWKRRAWNWQRNR
ncbi:beta-ketoacyl synthase chain length factor [Pseudomonas sp. TE3610]